jgi:hypothetical protein
MTERLDRSELPDRNWTDVYPPHIGNRFMIVVIGGVLILIDCAAYLHRFGPADPGSLLIGSAWLVGPPVFFIVEYYFIYPVSGDPAKFEQFKYGQELASKFWAAALLFLYAVATGKLPGAS